MTVAQALGGAAVVLGALGAGYLICHAQGAAAFRTAADSAAAANRARDSVRVATAAELVARDSAARADSLTAEAATRNELAEHALRVTAELTAADATAQLAGALTVADSVRLYRDSITPALGSEIGALTRELVAVDSSRAAWKDAYDQQVAKVTLLESQLASDSGLIDRQRQALLLAAKIGTAVTSPWAKLEGAAETGAIGAAVTGACTRKVLSIGCLAGTAEVLKRIL